MTKGRTIAWLLGVALVAGTVVVAQQVKRLRTADFGAKTMEWDWSTNIVEATGNCWLTVKGEQTAKLTAPAITVELDKGFNDVQTATAAGPVKIELLTAPNQDGLRRNIVASCTKKATYERGKQIIVMEGDVKADVTTLPEGEFEVQHFTGDKITADLKNTKLTVIGAHLQVTTEIDTEKGEQ